MHLPGLGQGVHPSKYIFRACASFQRPAAESAKRRPLISALCTSLPPSTYLYLCSHAPMLPCSHVPMLPCSHAPMLPCSLIAWLFDIQYNMSHTYEGLTVRLALRNGVIAVNASQSPRKQTPPVGSLASTANRSTYRHAYIICSTVFETEKSVCLRPTFNPASEQAKAHTLIDGLHWGGSAAMAGLPNQESHYGKQTAWGSRRIIWGFRATSRLLTGED